MQSVFAGGHGAFRAKMQAAAAGYAAAQPFPHAVFHGLFDEDVLRQCVAEFAQPVEMERQMISAVEFKSSESRWEHFSPSVHRVISDLNSGFTCEALEVLTGEQMLVSDPYLVGGGQHQIGRGGFLGVHTDFNVNERTGLFRRLNLLLYLNEGWRPEWEGSLELWDRQVTGPVVTVSPSINTCVVFTTDNNSFHGHPKRLACPAGTTRKSIALYYYTTMKPDDQVVKPVDFRTSAHAATRGGYRAQLSTAPTHAKYLLGALLPPRILGPVRAVVRRLLHRSPR